MLDPGSVDNDGEPRINVHKGEPLVIVVSQQDVKRSAGGEVLEPATAREGGPRGRGEVIKGSTKIRSGGQGGWRGPGDVRKVL